jgi:hypothetical protein
VFICGDFMPPLGGRQAVFVCLSPGLGSPRAFCRAVAARSKETVETRGANWNGQCDIPTACSNVFAIAAGAYHTLLLLDAPAAPPQLLTPARQDNSVSLLVQTLYRKNYALEFKNSLADTNWIALPTVRGNGALRVLSDPDASVSQRFYRLRQW